MTENEQKAAIDAAKLGIYPPLSEWRVGPSPISLRDYLAGQALAGLIAKDGCDAGHALRMAKAAYAIADAMIEARGD